MSKDQWFEVFERLEAELGRIPTEEEITAEISAGYDWIYDQMRDEQ